MLTFHRPPEPPNFARKTAAARATIERHIDAGRIPASGDFGPAWKNFKGEFEAVQRGKCGYCEHDTAVGYHGDVEHYAPKARIDELTGAPADPDTEYYPRRTVSDLGYYCRAYDWTNYLYACSKCNTHKGNLFPIAERVPARRPCTDSDETAMLLHPYEPGLDPGEHLRFDEHGHIFATTSRGRQTIDTCRLDRRRLVEARREVSSEIPGLIDKLEWALYARDTPGIVETLSELRELGHGRERFAGMVRIMVQHRTGRPWRVLMDLRDHLAQQLSSARS